MIFHQECNYEYDICDCHTLLAKSKEGNKETKLSLRVSNISYS